MPFNKYLIEPVKLSQNSIPIDEKDTLECNTNLTLANAIRQLSSLCNYANDMFDNLAADFKQLNERSFKLHQRLDKLKSFKIRDDKPVDVEAFFKMNHFKSKEIISKHLFLPETRPNSLKDLYAKAESPPRLDLLNSYKEDKSDLMKMYSDPTFFASDWRKTHRRKKVRKVAKQNEQIDEKITSAETDKNNTTDTNQQENAQTKTLYQNQQPENYENLDLIHYTEEFKQENAIQKEDTQNEQDKTNKDDNPAYINEQNYYSFTDDDDDSF